MSRTPLHVLAWLMVLGCTASVDDVRGQCFQRSWQISVTSYPYYSPAPCGVPQGPSCGVAQGFCWDSLQEAVAWEAGRQLSRLGLPMPYQTASCGPGQGDWRGATCGTCYDLQHAAAGYALGCLGLVDWESAVRQGVRNAVVRGFSGAGGDGPTCAAVGGSAGGLARFQSLVAAGVEDAVIEGFNRATVIPGLESFHGKDPPPAEKQSPAGNKDRPSDAPGAAPSAGDFPQPSEVPALPCRTQALPPIALHQVSTSTATDRRDPPEAIGDALAMHYSGPRDLKVFQAQYARARLVTSGWIASATGLMPLVGNRGFLLLSPRSDPQYVEVWCDGVLLAEKCRYAQYFEDAKLLATTGDSRR